MTNEINDNGKPVTSFLTDSEGKPSDTRLKSWVLFVFSLLIAVVMTVLWGFDADATIEEYQIPFFLFTICLAGGASWQLLAKAVEAMMAKRIK